MRKLAIVVALSSTVLATPALARNSAWYVGGDFGATIVEDIGFDYGIGPVIPGAGGNAQIGLNHDYGYDAALFVGYDLGAFRIEAEVAYKRARVDDIETALRLPGAGPATVPVGGAITPDLYPAGGGRTSALSFMINGMLDFGDDDGVSGFVGGGVGVARVDYNNVRAFSNQAAAIDDSDTRFAWQIVAGLRQAISDNIDITVRYRFFNADNIRTVDFRGLESESRFRSHSLLGGITFNFGAPPPPPPPPPPCPEGWSRDASGVCVAPPAPPPPPQTQTCPNGAVILATEACPEPPPIGPFIVFFD
jgi:opacity protein-like surface antigen